MKDKKRREIPEFRGLGHAKAEYTGLEVFPTPKSVVKVILDSDEVTAVCPVTGQPDWYRVQVTYVPGKVCVESKSFKLFLGTLRNQGAFCEDLSRIILEEVVRTIAPDHAVCIVKQKARGGVSITSEAWYKLAGEEGRTS